ncbi:hypothetical protein PICMEDRAFT_13495 [Pichia membranifaciens NRRL Y-2026]|uniref:Uncharacterized protein n=1 Tax=Pichia membranifaciens NRRL Y-2026 TaxID=763406 RepID=A0A1E3NFD2_9ASCO|nr:hypothetical protein PICMEDRAFT_13495 [Pichia membranifaciens NRRL Y-2026]ODQ44288.1 hypothetical protein PICMEDRAFT_13495 [Pichia membranifaciens NRRL Y-2026]
MGLNTSAKIIAFTVYAWLMKGALAAFSFRNIFRQDRAVVLIGASAVWGAVAAGVCATLGPTCWISLAMVAAFQAAGLAAMANDAGSVAENTKRSASMLPITETMQNITDAYENHNIMANPIIRNLTLLLGTVGEVSSGTQLVKRSDYDLAANITVAKFDSEFGHHLAIALPHLTSDEFVARLNSATPGEPDVSPRRRFFKRGYEVDWVSYNYDNVNEGLASQFINTQGASDTEVWSYGAESFISEHDGWKWCLDLNIDSSPEEPIDSNHLENINVAVHGEIYTNTYGGIDGQCNDYYDCVEGCD